MARKRHLFHYFDQSFLKFKSWLILFLVSLFLTFNLSPVLSQTSSEIKAIQEQIFLNYQSEDFVKVNDSLNKLIDFYGNQGQKGEKNLAITWTNLGHLQFRLGQSDLAFKSWQEAGIIYHKIQEKDNLLMVKNYQYQALQELGLYSQACLLLTETLDIKANFCQGEVINQNIIDTDILPKIKNEKSLLQGLENLGNLFNQIGRLEEAKLLLQTLSYLDSSKNETWFILGKTFKAIGDLERDRQAERTINNLPWQCNLINLDNLVGQVKEKVIANYHQAGEAYQKAMKNASPALMETIKLNQLSLLLAMGDFAQAENLAPEINWQNIPAGYSRVYAMINYGKSLACLKADGNTIIDLLNMAVVEAQKLNNPQVESYALGNLGGVYEYLSLRLKQEDLEKAQEYQQKALELTQSALYLANISQSPHIAYQWQWQIGRLYEEQGNQEQAIANYELAVKTLEIVRSDLLAINPDIQFSFRDNVEPLYRQLVSLLLSSKKQSPSLQSLEQSLNYIELLQLAELENFLGCNLSNNIQVTKITDPKTAIIYPIILKDRLAIITKLPKTEESLVYFETRVEQKEIQKTLNKLQKSLIQSGNTPEVITEASKVYQWLIKPLEPTLENNPEIDTLAFILDGQLRNIPMSVLYDGEKYLLEKNYAIAVIPGLTLFTPQLSSSSLKVFTGGVELPQVFAENLQFGQIKQLREELEQISQIVNTGQPLLNEQFTKASIEKKLESGEYTAIHWKTHGVFSSSPEDTFIVAYQDKITANDLNKFLQKGSKNQTQPLELLVLSACDTAQGDDRAVLGLAGIAVRAGAKSTLATLWRADDAANTLLMTRFYQELAKPGMTKAKALQQAQLSLLQEFNYQDTHVWATYVLIGNWL